MSNAVSALNYATAKGFVMVEEAGLRGMITVRGDLSSTALKNAVTGVAGVDMPGPREVNVVGDRGIAWMSPDELLVMVPYSEAVQAVEAISGKLEGEHFLAVNVSDARATFTLKGEGGREVLAKLAPVDMGAFQQGEIRRTRLAQVPGAFWMSGEDEFTVVAFRSVAQYVFDLLKTASIPGSEVGYL